MLPMPNQVKRTVKTATNARYATPDGSAISLEIVFVELEQLGPLLFHATRDDPESHGREIYNAALNGEYGVIAPYEPPTV